MKLGVMSALFSGRPLEEVVRVCAENGLAAIELPVGAYPGKPFFEPSKVLADHRSIDKPKCRHRFDQAAWPLFETPRTQ